MKSFIKRQISAVERNSVVAVFLKSFQCHKEKKKRKKEEFNQV